MKLRKWENHMGQNPLIIEQVGTETESSCHTKKRPEIKKISSNSKN